MVEMVKCPCGCGGEIIDLTSTDEEVTHDKLYKEYFAAFKEYEDTSVITPITLMVIGGISIVFLIGIPIFIIGAYLLIVNLCVQDAKRKKFDRARDRLVRYEEKHGYN